MVSSEQSWSIDKNGAGYPVFAMFKGVEGEGRGILPAVLKFKIDLKAGLVLRSSGSGNIFDVKTKRPVKAGDSLPVLYINGPSILSVEASDETKTASEAQPWFAAFQIEEKQPAAIAAWRIERKYVHR